MVILVCQYQKWKEFVLIPDNESINLGNNLFDPPWFAVKSFALAILESLLAFDNLNIL